MTRCPACGAEVVGAWPQCPLCRVALDGAGHDEGSGSSAAQPWPDVAVRYNWRTIARIVGGASLVVIAGTLGAMVFIPEPWVRLMVLGFAALWLVALIAVRKGHHVAKTIVYLVVVFAGLCVYADFLSGWRAWSTTFVIPILCGASIIALLVAVRIARMRPGDYLVYSWLTLLFSIVPALFLAFGWVTVTLPSWISVAMGFLMLVWMQVFHGAEVQHEVRKRLHV
ncbi:DUF6320 domain-containing protein [Propionibacteriaceae bacterium G57]|uniref:DUF6320 domain-containing protein n=1 Tax=Aestuariimicrobium sp. G57 TaxID=3418485 RepID=UPI003DA78AA8